MATNPGDLELGLWSSGGESWVMSAHLNAMQQRKLDLGILVDVEKKKKKLISTQIQPSRLKCSYMVLGDVWSSALVGSDLLDLHDLDRVRSGSVFRTHVTVELCDSAWCGQVSVLSVHVVGAASRVVSEPDGKVFDLQWFSIKDLQIFSISQTIEQSHRALRNKNLLRRKPWLLHAPSWHSSRIE